MSRARSQRVALKTGDRVRLPDGREGKLCWVIASGEEAAVALDGVDGTFHIHPSRLALCCTQ
jgi:hypothetical protein